MSNFISMNAKRLAHLKTITDCIYAEAPDVSTRSTGCNRYEGEEEFTVRYENTDLYCVRRLGLLDTSDLDYYNGTGYSCDVIYDDIAVLSAYDTFADEENEALVYELNEILSSTISPIIF